MKIASLRVGYTQAYLSKWKAGAKCDQVRLKIE